MGDESRVHRDLGLGSVAMSESHNDAMSGVDLMVRVVGLGS